MAIDGRLSSTGQPAPWWRAHRGTVVTPGQVAVMPERYSPSSSTTGRRTHRLVYRTGDVQVRMPSHAAINRYVRDNPEMTSFDLPVEMVSGGSRGMGMIRMTKSAETGRFEVAGGSGAYGGDSAWAVQARESAAAVVQRRRPRASNEELSAAAAQAEARLRGSTGGVVDGETTARVGSGMIWMPVTSSALARVGYDEAAQRMEVEFNHGGRGVYRNVDRTEYATFMAAPSVGSYYSRNIRSNPRFMGSSAAAVPGQAAIARAESSPAAPGQQSCPDCGQFVAVGAAHACVSARATSPGPAPVAASPDQGAPATSAEAVATPGAEAASTEEPASPEPAPVDPDAPVVLPPGSGWQTIRLSNGAAWLTSATGAQVRVDDAEPERVRAFIEDPTGTPVTALGGEVHLRGTAQVRLPEGSSVSQAALVLGSDTERAEMIVLTSSGRVEEVPLASLEEWEVIAGGSAPNVEVLDAVRNRRFPVSMDGIEMMPMSSTGLGRAGYDPVTERLRVELRNGVAYTYEGVPADQWRRLHHAESPDEFYADAIRRRYPVVPDAALGVRMSRPYMTPLQYEDELIRGVGYDPASSTLRVQTGEPGVAEARVTRYQNVTPEAYATIVSSDNAGQTFRDVLGPEATSEAGEMARVARSVFHHCPGCGQFVRPEGGAHVCPGPAGSPSGIPFGHPSVETGRPPSTTLQRARWIDGSAHLDSRAGWASVTPGVTENEFNRLVSDPEVTYAAWRAGRRLAGDGGEGPLPTEIRVPTEIQVARSQHQASRAFQVEEQLRIPSTSSIRQYARSHRDEEFDIPVRGSLADDELPDDAEGFGQATIEGHLRVRRDSRGRLHAEDPGTLTGGTPQQRRQMTQTVTAMLQARRVTGEFGRLRQAHLASTERLRGSAEASLRAREEAERRWAEQVSGVVGAESWTTDADRFQQHYQAARARRAAGEPAVPYLRENATGGLGARDGGRAFGVEIEFDIDPGVDRAEARQAILRDLKAEGVIPPAHPDRWLGYYQQRQHGYTMWKCTDDSTVAGEIVSPVMYDEPETWAQLEKVCEIVRRHGGRATARTGGHVHVAAGDFDHTVENHNRLLRDHAAYEDVLQRMGTNPERGTHRRNRYIGPNRPVPPAGYTTVSQVQVFNPHATNLNFQAVTGGSGDHVEFRQYDGSLDPAVIQTQIKLSLGLTSAAFAGRNADPAETEPIGTHREANLARQEQEGEAWQRSTGSFRRMVDRIFHREEDKAQATALFAITSWQSG